MGPPPEDYIETVFTCEGDFNDPKLHTQLQTFRHSLAKLLSREKEKLILKKVEPWNSVKVTFNIPSEAAKRLKCLAEQGHEALRQLGILSVQIEGDKVISLTIAGKNNERTELVFRTPADKSKKGSSSKAFDTSSSDELHAHGPSNLEATRKNIVEYLSKSNTGIFNTLFLGQSGSSDGDNTMFRSPNIVVTQSHPIPFPPGGAGVPAALSADGANRNLVSDASHVILSPFSSASTTIHALNSGKDRAEADQHFVYGPNAPNHLLQQKLQKSGASSSSPLLVNLLQTNLAAAAASQGGAASVNNPMPPPSAFDMMPPPKRKKRPRKLKTPPSSESLGAPLPASTGLGGISGLELHVASRNLHDSPHPQLPPYNPSPESSQPIQNACSRSQEPWKEWSPEKIINPYTGQMEVMANMSKGVNEQSQPKFNAMADCFGQQLNRVFPMSPTTRNLSQENYSRPSQTWEPTRDPRTNRGSYDSVEQATALLRVEQTIAEVVRQGVDSTLTGQISATVISEYQQRNGPLAPPSADDRFASSPTMKPVTCGQCTPTETAQSTVVTYTNDPAPPGQGHASPGSVIPTKTSQTDTFPCEEFAPASPGVTRRQSLLENKLDSNRGANTFDDTLAAGRNADLGSGGEATTTDTTGSNGSSPPSSLDSVTATEPNHVVPQGNPSQANVLTVAYALQPDITRGSVGEKPLDTITGNDHTLTNTILEKIDPLMSDMFDMNSNKDVYVQKSLQLMDGEDERTSTSPFGVAKDNNRKLCVTSYPAGSTDNSAVFTPPLPAHQGNAAIITASGTYEPLSNGHPETLRDRLIGGETTPGHDLETTTIAGLVLDLTTHGRQSAGAGTMDSNMDQQASVVLDPVMDTQQASSIDSDTLRAWMDCQTNQLAVSHTVDNTGAMVLPITPVAEEAIATSSSWRSAETDKPLAETTPPGQGDHQINEFAEARVQESQCVVQQSLPVVTPDTEASGVEPVLGSHESSSTTALAKEPAGENQPPECSLGDITVLPTACSPVSGTSSDSPSTIRGASNGVADPMSIEPLNSRDPFTSEEAENTTVPFAESKQSPLTMGEPCDVLDMPPPRQEADSSPVKDTTPVLTDDANSTIEGDAILTDDTIASYMGDNNAALDAEKATIVSNNVHQHTSAKQNDKKRSGHLGTEHEDIEGSGGEVLPETVDNMLVERTQPTRHRQGISILQPMLERDAQLKAELQDRLVNGPIVSVVSENSSTTSVPMLMTSVVSAASSNSSVSTTISSLPATTGRSSFSIDKILEESTSTSETSTRSPPVATETSADILTLSSVAKPRVCSMTSPDNTRLPFCVDTRQYLDQSRVAGTHDASSSHGSSFLAFSLTQSVRKVMNPLPPSDLSPPTMVIKPIPTRGVASPGKSCSIVPPIITSNSAHVSTAFTPVLASSATKVLPSGGCDGKRSPGYCSGQARTVPTQIIQQDLMVHSGLVATNCVTNSLNSDLNLIKVGTATARSSTPKTIVIGPGHHQGAAHSGKAVSILSNRYSRDADTDSLSRIETVVRGISPTHSPDVQTLVATNTSNSTPSATRHSLVKDRRYFLTKSVNTPSRAESRGNNVANEVSAVTYNTEEHTFPSNRVIIGRNTGSLKVTNDVDDLRVPCSNELDEDVDLAPATIVESNDITDQPNSMAVTLEVTPNKSMTPESAVTSVNQLDDSESASSRRAIQANDVSNSATPAETPEPHCGASSTARSTRVSARRCRLTADHSNSDTSPPKVTARPLKVTKRKLISEENNTDTGGMVGAPTESLTSSEDTEVPSGTLVNKGDNQTPTLMSNGPLGETVNEPQGTENKRVATGRTRSGRAVVKPTDFTLTMDASDLEITSKRGLRGKVKDIVEKKTKKPVSQVKVIPGGQIKSVTEETKDNKLEEAPVSTGSVLGKRRSMRSNRSGQDTFESLPTKRRR